MSAPEFYRAWSGENQLHAAHTMNRNDHHQSNTVGPFQLQPFVMYRPNTSESSRLTPKTSRPKIRRALAFHWRNALKACHKCQTSQPFSDNSGFRKIALSTTRHVSSAYLNNAWGGGLCM